MDLAPDSCNLRDTGQNAFQLTFFGPFWFLVRASPANCPRESSAMFTRLVDPTARFAPIGRCAQIGRLAIVRHGDFRRIFRAI